MKINTNKFNISKKILFFILGSLSALLVFFLYKNFTLNKKLNLESLKNKTLNEKLIIVSKKLKSLESEDQYKINQEQNKEIENIRATYKKAVSVYESLLKFKEISKQTIEMDEMLADAINNLAEKNYASADAQLTELSKKITQETEKFSSSFTIPENISQNNTPPGSGFSRQKVSVNELGDYLVDIIAADLSSTKVVVDTASDSTCSNDCPVLSLADYVSRSSAFAGINGSYFCPSSYPSCAGKTNSFDTLLMNKNKVYFNSDNNKFSTVPAVIFGNGWIRFVGQTVEWGRDTGIDGMIANQPLLVSGGGVVFGGDGDPKKGGKGSRSFVSNKDNTVYIGVVHNATVAEVARVLKTMGMDNGLNLDSGGSTALWSGGYKVGPGRNIPNAILFVRK